MASAPAPAAKTPPRGRIDKRNAILAAAFDVFATHGYAQTLVQQIAEAAGVAKPTVYNHFTDKEALFRASLTAEAEAVMRKNIDVLDRLRSPGDDLRAALSEVALRLARSCCDKRSRSLRWLTYAQVARFPDLIEVVQGCTSLRISEALADRLSRLTVSGRLRPCDPELAAEQLLALITGPLEVRSRLGTRRIGPAELRELADAAVDTFLHAYGAETPDVD
ncbi:TetR/AcrR family transcriptional regulator [Streptomyces kunmingensis]|uniref:TetR/AcrR family transcriptional regulator n=1 Tax=Streptomyces kunmingensis TaxID=68225 RepID=A0ABU6CJG5_9ACTN|nr:TetR/AcrR family transcriptional regulator [Streptomyces kunmingensis]MEB3964822.1 TetR/AcrR family transcriptional regulator [Streptomyces kunmingensis]